MDKHDPAVETERALLGVLLRDPRCRDDLDLEPDDFLVWAHQEVYRAITGLRAKGSGVDPVTVADALGDKTEAVGGIPFLAELVTAGGVSDLTRRYGEIVAAAGLTRRVRKMAAEIAGSPLQGADLLAEAARQIAKAGERQTDGAVEAGVAAVQAWRTLGEMVDARQRNEAAAWGIPTGFADLDFLLGGLRRGVVTILGGRPSQGKSALARGIADNLSARGVGVHHFSQEDSAESMSLRTLAAHSGIDLGRIRTLDLGRHDLTAIAGAAADLNQRRGWLVDDAAGLSSQQIATRVRRHKRENRTELVVVDYVQLMRERGTRDRREEVERAAAGLVDLARAEHVAVLLLSQLSRESEKDKGDRRPQLWHLRESGALEQVADAVVFVHRPDDNGTVTEALVRKNKHGPVGTALLGWDAGLTRFRDATELERTRSRAEAMKETA